jgi:predicted dehydrogenase
MKVLVIGLGSMGKRRIRCLKSLGFSLEDIAGMDLSPARREETATLHGIATYDSLDAALKQHAPKALVISVPPDAHHIYMKKAAQLRLPFFVEASVVDTDLDAVIALAKQAGIVAAPSSTLYFHPAIQTIAQVLKKGVLGKVSNILYHSGQYLPDWHTYEHVREYYVSNPATGGAREIVPFELTWLVEVLGWPRRVAGMFRKTIDIEGAPEIDDTYNALLDYGDFLLNLSVDVVSRNATRRLLINGDKKQLRWDWSEKSIQLFDPAGDVWEALPYTMGQAQEGYNANIGENMYIDELGAFIKAVRGEALFVNTLEKDHMVLKILYAIEQADRESRFVACDFAS